jgi:hypothetical protein
MAAGPLAQLPSSPDATPVGPTPTAPPVGTSATGLSLEHTHAITTKHGRARSATATPAGRFRSDGAPSIDHGAPDASGARSRAAASAESRPLPGDAAPRSSHGTDPSTPAPSNPDRSDAVTSLLGATGGGGAVVLLGIGIALTGGVLLRAMSSTVRTPGSRHHTIWLERPG